MPAPRWRRALPPSTALALLATLGCSGGSSAPAPKKVSEGALIEPPKRPLKTGPFRDPRIEPPPPRSEPQLAPAELDKTLASARALVEEGQLDRAILTLRTCANKVPASGRCEGELAMLLADKKGYKAEFKYYLAQASETDDPKADADFYRRLAKTAQDKGDFLAGAQAMRFALDRGADDAADHAFYAECLSGEQDTLPDAIAAYRAALAKDPEQHRWRYDMGSLLAQTGHPLEAITELRTFLQATEGQDERRDAKIRAWIAELQAQADREGKTSTGKPRKGRAAKGKPSKPSASK